MIRAVTFDLWDTIVVDDSDEAMRAARGMPSKKQAREELFVAEVLAHHPEVGQERAAAAFAHCNERFRHWWKVEHHTPHIALRLETGLRWLGVGNTPGFDALVKAFSRMEVDLPPDLAPGIEACLAALHGSYRLGIVSDAIVTPGRDLRDILKGHGLLHYFDVCVFSDEAGAAKPAPRVFEVACEALDCRPSELIHIGDREANDVAGPVNFGSHAVLYTGVIDRGDVPTTRADVVCTHHDELPSAIAGLRA
jgi:putative hydrolase of the HAD superfamily